MSNGSENDLVRRLELLSAIQPLPEATEAALNRVRESLTESPIVKLRFSKRMFLRRLAAAAAILMIAGTLTAWYFLHSRTQTEANFAAVRSAMKAPATVTFRQTIGVKGEEKREVSQVSVKNGLWRDESSDGKYSVADPSTARTLVVFPVKQEAVMFHGKGPAPGNLFVAVKNLPSSVAAKSLETKTIEGKEVVGFSVKALSQEVAVWADVETQLPVKIESQGSDDQGRTVECVLDEFEFDKILDDGMFSLAEPEGFRLDTKGVAISQLILTPRDGLGPVKFGMSKEEVTKLLGAADAMEDIDGKVVALSYASRGFGVAVSNAKGVMSISCFDRPGDSVLGIVRFGGKTDKGIALGASADDIVAAYGQPDAKQSNNGLTQLRYDELQAEFTLSNDNKLLRIWLFRQ